MGASPSVVADRLRVAGVHNEHVLTVEQHHNSLERAHTELHADCAQTKTNGESEDGLARDDEMRSKMCALIRNKCNVNDEAQLMLIMATVEELVRQQGPQPGQQNQNGSTQEQQSLPRVVYVPHPQNTDNIELSQDLVDLTELLAENTHEEWALQRTQQGWTYGMSRDDEHKLHPCLVPYSELTDEEKEYDRITAMKTLKLLLSFGYTITPPSKSKASSDDDATNDLNTS
ncbi:Ryanodine receptor [Hondaea fermentalgiana]|uniref:Ryanodine receptor n=1 Tax=Hondaea fermentalgiana TaxID=2315210 RepID=A0A2R5GDI7_9STRA|nr:Ryanodine receptor [Hondaea fermentalgiana]|eukprot:GBG26261.1 Ryanodine receptor [Hondaea fermentalgiana]